MHGPEHKSMKIGTRLRRLFWILAAMFSGVIIAVIAGGVFYLTSRPDLSVWHTVSLTEEFTAAMPMTRFEDYLALENRLFAELDTKVYDAVPPGAGCEVMRYCRGSLSDPGRWPTNWNRSFELAPAAPSVGVLLIHGMSDSPYSLRSIGLQLAGAGARVLGLRVPGHGTAPSGLVNTTWEDMAAAVTLSMAHLKKTVGDRPIYIVGYSNGSALALNYALTALVDETLPAVAGMVMISPEIAVTPAAALARWQAWLGDLLGLPKLQWNDLTPEYDPFKYGSFAVNAGEQSHRITSENKALIARRAAEGKLRRMPPILSFQSIVDATVIASAVITDLFDRLPGGGHELVLYDLNRLDINISLMDTRSADTMASLLGGSAHPYGIRLITNSSPSSRDVVMKRTPPGGGPASVEPLEAAWPSGVYSLSHVALPFPPEDPLYGGDSSVENPGIRLGSAALFGERGVPLVNPGGLLRQHWNPFYDHMAHSIHRFLGLSGDNTDFRVGRDPHGKQLPALVKPSILAK